MRNIRFAIALAVLTATTGAAQPSCAVAPQRRVLDLLPRGPNNMALQLTISAGGGKRHVMLVDTGSTGIAIWKGYIGKSCPALDITLPPVIEYNSSGKKLLGHWVYTSVTIFGAGANQSAIIDHIPVLAVEKVACPQCTDPQKELENLGMMGVGFDRGPNMGTSRENPFLHIREMEAGTMQRAYAVTGRTITLGLPPNVDEFTFVPLQPNPGEAFGWQQAQGCARVSGGGIDQPFGPMCGSILMDTGVPEMFLSFDPALRPTFGGKPVKNLPPGTNVSITWPSFTYPFTVVPTQDWTWTNSAPRFVTWGVKPPNEAIFVNTSRQLLTIADYLYDATCGRVGFRRHS